MALWSHRFLSFRRYPSMAVDLLALALLRAGWWGLGVRVGRGCRLHGVPIISTHPGSQIVIGPEARLESRAQDTSLGVAHPVVLRTLTAGASLTIGRRFWVSGITVCAARSIVIGDGVMAGADAAVFDTDFHSLDAATRNSPSDAAGTLDAPVVIEDGVFLGARCMVLKGVRIGRGAVIGAAAVVTKDVASGTIVAGNPARVVGSVRPASCSLISDL